jgi:flavin-dependent dehydrogenase
LLGIKADRGPRNDVAHFAHFENFSSDSTLQGQIVISVLKSGWSWQIPLRNCTSVGVVLNGAAAQSYGSTATERLECVMRDNSVLRKKNYRRMSRVMTYSNYQLLSQQGFGKGWVLLGDAFGFVDPMLSPGVTMSLKSAELLDELLFEDRGISAKKRNAQLERYVTGVRQWHAAWTSLIEYFYDGRLLCLGEMRPDPEEEQRWYSFGRLVDLFVSRVMVSLVSGVGTRSYFNTRALAGICRVMVRDKEKQSAYAIKSERNTGSLRDL